MNAWIRKVASSTALCSLVALVGCGSGELVVEDPDGELEEEDEPPPQEQFDEGEPAYVLVDLSPTRHIYDVGSSIQPSARVFDPTWHELDDVELQWAASPDDAAEMSDGDWSIQQEGELVFEACVVGDDGDVTSVCGSRSATTTNEHRALVIESPRPGEHFAGVDTATIPVTGTVEGALGAGAVRINGQPADVDGDGNFSLDLEPDFGINTILVEAYDGVHDEEVSEVTSAMWAPDYRAPDTEGGIDFWFDEALVLSVGQNFVDDGQPYLQPSSSEIVTRDLADILELVVEYLDFTAEIPDPVIDSSTIQLSVDEVIPDDPEIEILVTDRGLEIFGRLHALEIHTDGSLELSDEPIGLGGSVVATVSLYGAIDIEKESYAHNFETEVTDLALAVDHVEPNFDADEADAVFELADSALREDIEQIILDSLDLSFVESLPEVLEEFLDSIDDTIDDQQLVVDLGYGDPLYLDFGGQIDTFDPVWSRGLELTMAGGVSTDGLAPSYPDNPGVALFAPEAEQTPLLSEGRLQIGLGFDVLNAIYHTVWNSGMFDIEVTEILPDGLDDIIDDGHAEGLLPPVISPPDADQPHDLVIHLGQLELQLDWPDQSDRYGLEILVGADFVFESQEFGIDVEDDPQINLWLIETTEDQPELSVDEFQGAIETFFWPDMQEAIEETVGAFQLPAPGFDVVDDFAPGLSELELAIKLDRAASERNGFLMLDAAIEGELEVD